MSKNWEVKTLDEVCEFGNGLWTGKKPPFLKVGVIRNTNFTRDGRLDDSDIVFLDVEQTQFAKRKLQYGDIILEKSGGGPKQPVGRVILFDKAEGNFSFSNFTSVIRITNSKTVDYKYLHRFLFFLYISGVTESMQSHSTGIRNLKFGEYKKMRIPLPPIAEQKRILAIIDEAFSAIAKAKENAERNLKNAKELFESYLQGVFHHSTRSGQGWREVTLGEVCENMMTGPFGSMLHKSDYIDNGIPVVNPQNIIDGKIVSLRKTMISADKYNSLKKYSLKLGDIVIARRGEMGRCAIVEIENVGWLCGTGSFVLRLNMNIADIQFINIILSSNSVKKELEKSSIGATMSNLNQSILSDLKFSIPSLSEQQKIVQKLDSLSAETKRLESTYQSKIKSFDELKQSILQKAFSGKLSDKDVAV